MIGIASDHGGFELKQIVVEHLKQKGMPFTDEGVYDTNSADYPDYAEKVANGVVSGKYSRGIVVCGTGIGISIAANKVKGIRCALCNDVFSAKMAREHNNSNMLALGGRVIGSELALMIVDMWLDTEFSPEEKHHRRVDKIMAIENK